MNIEALRAVRSKLSGMDSHSFDMGVWIETDCGTTACIAGWAVLLDDPEVSVDDTDVMGQARKLLGLTHLQAQKLFLGPPTARSSDAVKAIDNLIERGMPHWNEVMNPPAMEGNENG